MAATRLHHGHVAQHAGLDGVGADVVQHGAGLGLDDFQGNGVDAGTPRVFWTVMAVMAVAA
jgi:hypothetical protein